MDIATITPAYEITLTRREYVTIYDNFDSPGASVDVKCPVFNDTDEQNIQRILRESRGGRLLSYTDPNWCKIRTFNWKFENLYHTDLAEIKAVLLAYPGKYIKIIDYLTRTWKAVVLDLSLPSEDKRLIGGHSLELKWEGELC